MSVQKGVGVIWGLGGFSVSGTGVYATGQVQSVRYTLGGQETEIKGADGVTLSLVLFGHMDSITVEVIPSGATLAAAKACGILPARGADITVADTDDTGSQIVGSSTGNGTGTYIFTGGTVNKGVADACTITMELRRYEKHLATVAAS